MVSKDVKFGALSDILLEDVPPSVLLVCTIYMGVYSRRAEYEALKLAKNIGVFVMGLH